MNPESEIAPPGDVPKRSLAIKVFGVGKTGVKVIEPLLQDGHAGMTFAAVSTDGASLAVSSAPEKIHLETQQLRGMGTGGDPERGQAAAEEQAPKLKAACEGADVVFIVTGLGGGAGTGISPVLARAAQEAGALVLGFATTPFACEGRRRQALAQEGLQALKGAADGVICLPNHKICKCIDENTSVLETFKITNNLLADGVRGVWRLLSHTGLIEIHFADLCALVRGAHTESSFAVAETMGPTRSREILEKLFAHPMLDGGEMLADSEAVLVSLIGGPDLTMAEVNRVMEQVQGHCEHAQVIMGAAIDESFRERLAVTLIAARKDPEQLQALPKPPASAEGLDVQLLNRSETSRPGSRFVPPPPSLSQEKLEQLLARKAAGAGRGRRKSSKMRQGQLPLDIVSKGRFDKSEPTIHRGEDLDVPTYIRRGIALN